MKGKKQATLSRRQFAKLSAGAGVAVLSSSVTSAEVNTDTLKIGLIGCGGRGSGAMRQFLEGNDNVVCVALADVFPDKIQELHSALEKRKEQGDPVAAKYIATPETHFVGLDAFEKLLATDIDVVIHGTPPYARPGHIEAAVKANKHIFTEKPVAVDPAGIRQFIAAAQEAEKKGLSFVTGTQRRHQKVYVESIKKIHDGAIGDIMAGRAYWCGTLPFAHDRKPEWSDLEYRLRNWYNQVWTSGDNIVEQHIHNLDVLNWAIGSHPISVFASGGRAWKPNEEKYGDIYDHFSCDYEYPGGIYVTSMSRHWNDSSGGVFEWVKGTKGESNCMDLGEQDEISPYVQEHIDLVASIRGTGPYLNEGVRTAESTMTAIMGRMSAFSGKKLSWSKALNADLDIVPKDLSFDKAYPLGPVEIPGGERAWL